MTLATLAALNVVRNKARLLLTVLGVAVAVVTFVTLRTALRSWGAAEGLSRRDRVVTRHKVTFILPLPRRYVDQIRALRAPDGEPVAKAVTFSGWFGGKDPKHDRTFFASMAVDGASYFDVYDEIEVSATERAAFAQDRSGAVVSGTLARELGWKLGDRVTLESPIYPAPEGQPWTFTIDGIYRAKAKSVDGRGFMFHYERLDDALPPDQRGMVGLIASRTVGGASGADLGRTIDRIFDGADTETLSEDERAFNMGFMGMVSAVLDVVGVLAGVILVILALILANTIGMSARERTAEYAALQALGFRPRHVAALVLGESVLVAVLGGAVGVLLSYVVVDRGLGGFFESQLAFIFPIFRVDAPTTGLAFCAAVALGALAAVVPAWRAARLSVTEALRKVA